MPLILVRVDCRLLHGQILEAWVPFTQAECVVVANDEVAQDSLQKAIMQLAVPPSVELAVMTVQEAANTLNDRAWTHKRVICLLANCQDTLSFFKAGPHFDKLNLGNLDCTSGKKQVSSSVSLDETDLRCLKEISDQGVHIEIRTVPQHSPRPIKELIRFRRFS